MAMGVEPSVPSAQSTGQTTTSPAKALFPDLAERIFSLMVWPAIPIKLPHGGGSVIRDAALGDGRASTVEQCAQAGQFRFQAAALGLRRAVYDRQQMGNFPIDPLGILTGKIIGKIGPQPKLEPPVNQCDELPVRPGAQRSKPG